MALELSPLFNISGIAKTAFYIALIPLFFYSTRFYIHGTIGAFFNLSKKRYTHVPEGELPKVSVHIPVYNDPVVKQCIDHCLAFNYPKNKLEILVADDSTDETVGILDSYKNNKQVKVIRRDSRKGFKAGALNTLIPETNGDIVIVFDSDYTPEKNFVRKIIRPFYKNNKIAYVQSRWGYVNPNDNSISKVAAMCFNSFHRCMMPLHNKIGSAIFCGTGGAIRTSVLKEVRGWNENTVSEDLDISIRILQKGYKQEYLPDLVAVGEVPTTMKAFIKQQQRWAYGTTDTMLNYMDKIITSKTMTFFQKLDFSLLLPAFFVFPFIAGVFLSSMIASNPFFGAEAVVIPTTIQELGIIIQKSLAPFFGIEGLLIFLGTSGFLYTVLLGLLIDRKYSDIMWMPMIYVIGLVMQFTNTVSVAKAVFGVPVTFYKTPKKAI